MGDVQILESYTAPGRGPVGLCTDGRFLWNADFSTGKIYRLDPATLESDIELVCPGNLSGLAWDGRSLWQSLHDGGTLRRINPDTNDFDQAIMVWEHGWLAGVAWDGTHLWTASQQHGKLFKLDPESGDVLATVPVPVAGGGLDFHDGSLWLGVAYPMRFDTRQQQFEWEGSEQRYAILRLDPATGTEQTRYHLDFLPMGLAWLGDQLWLSHVATRKLHRTQLI